jgi:DNA gyrase subunit A
MLISTGGTMIRMSVDGIKRMGRATQGVIVMRLGKGEMVSSIAPVVESEAPEPDEAPAEPAAE